MELRVDRDASASGTRVLRVPALIAPLESTVITLDDHRIDRSLVALVPARSPHALELPAAGAVVVATLSIEPADRAAALRDYAPYIDARRFTEVLAAPRLLPRTRWVDELVQRYVFEREVCEKPGSRAARFLEAELAKEIYFLGCEQLDRRTRTSVLHEGAAVAVRARAWIDDHLFEPFRIEALVAACAASESTVLRAFRKEYGVAPVVYLRRRRLEEAMQLLESGRYAVTEVATRVGYDNPSAFAAAFREQFGTPPSAVRPVLDAAAVLPAHGAPPVRRGRRSGPSARASGRSRSARGSRRRRRARASSSD
jgi:AraC-like DNA-binding protein